MVTPNQNRDQSLLKFKWEVPLHYKRAYLTPRKELIGWASDGDEGYVNTMSRNLTTKGGKLSIFKISVKGKAGYMVLDGYDELNKLFDIKYLD